MRTRQAGFTLIELLMTILLMSIISVVASKFFLQVYNTYLTSKNITDADWQGLMALNRMADDIHDIRSAQSITTITATSMTFVNNSGTTIQYSLSGSSLLRNSITLADGVKSLALSYKNSSGSTTATASAVRYVTISATLTKNNITTTFTTTVGTRGLT